MTPTQLLIYVLASCLGAFFGYKLGYYFENRRLRGKIQKFNQTLKNFVVFCVFFSHSRLIKIEKIMPTKSKSIDRSMGVMNKVHRT